jgi:DNA-binding MarR family transcriptional regulator
MREEAMKQIRDDVGYQLIQLCKEHRRLAEEALNKLGLHAGQEQILFCLWQEDGIPQSQLAASLAIDISTTTKMVQRMERTGLVKRQTDGQDARVSRVYLTEHGRALCEPALQVWKVLEERLWGGLTVTERTLLRRLLQHVVASLA